MSHRERALGELESENSHATKLVLSHSVLKKTTRNCLMQNNLAYMFSLLKRFYWVDIKFKVGLISSNLGHFLGQCKDTLFPNCRRQCTIQLGSSGGLWAEVLGNILKFQSLWMLSNCIFQAIKTKTWMKT